MTILPLSSQIAPKMSGSWPCPPRGTSSRLVQVVELDAKFQVLLDDILDRDRRVISTPLRGRIAPAEPRRRVQSHRRPCKELEGSSRFNLICFVAAQAHGQGAYLSFAFCACRASRAMSSAVSPLAARRKSAISRGRSRMMSVRSDATRPASASNSSGSAR